MRSRFSLRFVIAEGIPSIDGLHRLWPRPLSLARDPSDGVLTLHDGDRALATLDLLTTDDPRSTAVLAAIARLAERHGQPEALETVRFLLDGASAVLVAQPSFTGDDDADIEAALEPLDALWDLLFDEHGGLLQIDDEGIYGDEGLLISFEAPA